MRRRLWPASAAAENRGREPSARRSGFRIESAAAVGGGCLCFRGTTVDSAVPPADSPRGPDTAGRGRLVVVSNRVVRPVGKALNPAASPWRSGRRSQASGGIWFGWSGDVADGRRCEPAPQSPADRQRFHRHHSAHPGGARQLLSRLRQPLPLAALPLPARPGRSQHRAETGYYRREPALRQGAVAAARARRHDLGARLPPHSARPPICAQQRRDEPIGFFLHIPFPSPEIFAALPNHQQLARSFFAYDLVGFQTVRDRENFARYTVEHLGCRRLNDGRIQGFGRTLTIDAFPIGIDAKAFAAEAETNVRAPRLRALARGAGSHASSSASTGSTTRRACRERIRGIERLLKRIPTIAGACSSCRSRRRRARALPPTTPSAPSSSASPATSTAASATSPGRRSTTSIASCRDRFSPASSAAPASAWSPRCATA